MPTTHRRSLRYALLCTALILAAALPAADGWQHAVAAPPVDGEAATFRMWLPGGLQRARAAMLFVPHGSYTGWAISDEARALATELESAIIMADTKALCDDDGSPERVLDALRGLATTSGHPEVANLPLMVFGHSNSTRTMGDLARQIPERIVCWVAMKSAYGGQFEHPELAPIPGMVVCGEHDHAYFQDQLESVAKMRRDHGALVHVIVESEGPHWPVASTFQIQNAFLRHAFYRRVPYDADAVLGAPPLLAIDERSGWLGQSLSGKRVLTVEGGKRSWSWDRPVQVRTQLAIARFDDFPGDPATASWLPGPDYAQLWQAYCASLSTSGCDRVPSALLEAWRASRAVVEDDGLDSDLLPEMTERLRSSSSAERTLKQLRQLAAGDGEEATEAARLIARVEAMADERRLQAERLEATHLPTAVGAYQLLAKRYGGTAAGDAASERLKSRELKQAMDRWKLLARLRELGVGLQQAGGRTIADAAFAKANARSLRELRAIALRVIADAPNSPAATEAAQALKRYGIPVE